MEYYKKEELKEMPWLIHNYKQDKRQIHSNSNDLIDFEEVKKSKEDEKENKFDKAKKIAPSIIFIDEVDAIGKKRS